MDVEIRQRFTRETGLQAANLFCRRYIGYVGFIACAVVLQSAGYLWYSGTRNWMPVTFVAVVALYAAMTVALWLTYRRRSVTTFAAMSDPTVTYRITDATIRATSVLGHSEIPWSGLLAIWRFPTVWLLLVRKDQYVTFPLPGVQPEVLAFIATQVRAHGGRIRCPVPPESESPVLPEDRAFDWTCGLAPYQKA